MSNKTRSILKAAAVILVLLAVMMHIGWISIAFIGAYKFWMVIIAFGLLLIGSR
jgi:putative Mn2+ efflux pump MntP